MNNHTPGPWKAVEANTDYSGTFNRILSISDAEIAPARAYGDTEEQRHANARLIAAAPDLLDACKNIVAACELTEDAYYDAIDTAMNIARAAIAKAEGTA